MFFAKYGSDLKPIHNRNAYVDYDNIRIETKDGADCFLSVLGGSGDFEFSAQFSSDRCQGQTVVAYSDEIIPFFMAYLTSSAFLDVPNCSIILVL